MNIYLSTEFVSCYITSIIVCHNRRNQVVPNIFEITSINMINLTVATNKPDHYHAKTIIVY